jgi:hypothetical protein
METLDHIVFATLSSSYLEQINYSQILETNSTTVGKSIDESLFSISWYTSSIPTFISDNSVELNWSGSYTNWLDIVDSTSWTPSDPEAEE